MQRQTVNAVSTKPTGSLAAGLLQRQCACGNQALGGECSACKNSKQSLRRKSAGANRSDVPPIVHDVLRASGRPLDAATRDFMEPRFQRDFSNVRVHSDARAAESAQSVGALAYTVGDQVVFGASSYAPETAAGRRLLAHELAHVAQQQGQAPSAQAARAGLQLGASDDALEHEADRAADAALAGRALPATAATRPVLQRQAAGGAAARDVHTPSTAPPDSTSPRTHAVTNYGLGIFESELSSFRVGSPCMLTLRLNLSFDFVDTSAGFAESSETGAPTRTRWSPTEQNAWINTFVRAVTSRWSYRYQLVPTSNTTAGCLWPSTVCDRAMARVEVIPVVTGQDAVIHVARSPSSYRSRAGYGNAYLTEADTNLDSQVTVEHEFGHLLGLDHANPNCQSTTAGPAVDPGRSDCYQGTPEQTASIMGSGSVVRPQDYAPFVAEMNYHTAPCTWRTEGTAASSSEPFRHTGLVVGSILGTAGGAVVGGLLGAQGSLGAAGGAVLGGLVGLGSGLLVGAIADAASR